MPEGEGLGIDSGTLERRRCGRRDIHVSLSLSLCLYIFIYTDKLINAIGKTSHFSLNELFEVKSPEKIMFKILVQRKSFLFSMSTKEPDFYCTV